MSDPFSQLKLMKQVHADLAQASLAKRNRVLLLLERGIIRNQNSLLKANQHDVSVAQKSGKFSAAFIDRLTLNPRRVKQMQEVLREVQMAADPLGRILEKQQLANGLKVSRVSRPIGLIFLIFESRPNVVIESFALAVKSGNALVLKSGRESSHTVQLLYRLMKQALRSAGLSEHLLLGLPGAARKQVKQLLKAHNLIDVVIPRGGEGLIDFVSRESRVPIIKNDRGLCHIYIDQSANLTMAVQILLNAKLQRPGVCNSAETVLVHQNIAEGFFREFCKHLSRTGLAIEIRACPASRKLLKETVKLKIKPAKNSDWDTEHLDAILNARVVKNFGQALEHIARHGSRHSEAIVTSNSKRAEFFLNSVDAAAVYWNASTRFTDGQQLGLGGEIGISTQKLHARGPVGLQALTTYQWIMRGKGQIRKG